MLTPSAEPASVKSNLTLVPTYSLWRSERAMTVLPRSISVTVHCPGSAALLSAAAKVSSGIAISR